LIYGRPDLRSKPLLRTESCSVVRNIIQRIRREDGQALVELAFVLPLIVLFLFAIIDFGLALNTDNSDTNLANLAVRQVAVMGTATTAPCDGIAEATITAYVDCEAKETGVSTPLSVCSADTAAASTSSTYSVGDPIKIEVTTAFNWSHILTGNDSYVGSITNPVSHITATATMRLEAAPSGGTSSFLPSSTTCSS
jgi:Flp pilus assembly protein TadG